MRRTAFPRSSVLILGQSSVQSLLPSTLITQIESLLEAHRTQDALNLADQQRRKLEGQLHADADEAEELEYVYQCIGFKCLSDTLFVDAGQALFTGKLDPRVLISYFPDLRGALFGEDDAADMYAGVTEHMPPEASVDDIVRNYSPHLAPNTREAKPTVELRKILIDEAHAMLETFLRRLRALRPQDGGKGKAKVVDVHRVVDTVLAKLYALNEKPGDLASLLQGQNDVMLSELEPILERTGQLAALCALYRQRGEDAKLLEVYSKLVEGVWKDSSVRDPLGRMVEVLTAKRDRALNQRWGIWLSKKDPKRAMKILTSRDTSKKGGKTEDDLAMLEQLREANPVAAVQFLEHLVMQKRSIDKNLHNQLATTCINQVLEHLADESVLKLWRAKASSYASATSISSFLSYFAFTTPDSPSKRARLKAILFLQGSAYYDVAAVRERLEAHAKVLPLEMAILDGKLGNHREALTTLVRALKDGVSAEAYCTLGGHVVSPRAAIVLGEKVDLLAWAGAFFGEAPAVAKTKSGGSGAGPSAGGGGMLSVVPIEREKSVDQGLKQRLLRLLLEVYMEDGESAHTAKLLNSQAVNLDVVDIVPLVPPDWSVDVLSSFLARSFRRTLHARHEAQIVKAISSGQNLRVADDSWLVLREAGALVEEAAEEEDDGDASAGGGASAGQSFDEKGGMAEKVALHLQAQAQADAQRAQAGAVDISVPAPPGR